MKKYFVGLEKGCTFASVFRRGKRQYIETDEKKEIACVKLRIYIKEYAAGHEDESKR